MACDQGAGSGEKFEPISPNPYLSIINRLFNKIIRLFLEFLLEIENFIENWSDISLKFFIWIGYFQISTGYLITKPRFSPDIARVEISDESCWYIFYFLFFWNMLVYCDGEQISDVDYPTLLLNSGSLIQLST